MSNVTREGWLAALDDAEELNRMMQADPVVAASMEAEGFVISIPFQKDHNGNTVAKYMLTARGKEEIQARMMDAVMFELEEQRKHD